MFHEQAQLVEIPSSELYTALDFRRRIIVVHSFIPYPNPPLKIYKSVYINTAMAIAYTSKLLSAISPGLLNVIMRDEIQSDNPLLRGHLRFDFNKHEEQLRHIYFSIRESIAMFCNKVENSNGFRSAVPLAETFGTAVGYAEICCEDVSRFLTVSVNKKEYAHT